MFAGGWTLDAAAAVTRDDIVPEGAPRVAVDAATRLETLDGLSRLVDRSLVVVDREGATRYRMLETIRQYANDRLAASGEANLLRDRHLELLRDIARNAERGLEGAAMAEWLERLDAEIDNLRAALDWAFETNPGAALEICAALTSYWKSRAIAAEGTERTLQAVEVGRRWLSEPSTVPEPERTALLARVMARAAELQATHGGRSIPTWFNDEAMAMALRSGDRVVVADLTVHLAFAGVSVDGSIPTDGPVGEAALEAAAVAEEIGDWYHVSMIQAGFAMYLDRRDPTTAAAWIERADVAARRSGNPFAIANVEQARGRAASLAGRFPEARQWLESAAARFGSIGDRLFVLVIRSELAHALRRAGVWDEAEVEYCRTVSEWQRGGNRGAIANQLECFAFLALARGRDNRAARLLGAAEALREVANAPMTAFEREEYDAEVGRLRQELDEGALTSAWAVGQRMTADEAVELALSG